MEETIEITDIKKICKTLENNIPEKTDPGATVFNQQEYDEIFIELFVHNTLFYN